MFWLEDKNDKTIKLEKLFTQQETAQENCLFSG